jgi:hypothetical protein
MRVNKKQALAFILPTSDRGAKEVRGRQPWAAQPKPEGVATGAQIDVMSQPVYSPGDGDRVCIVIRRAGEAD